MTRRQEQRLERLAEKDAATTIAVEAIRFCGGAQTPEEERNLYEKAKRGEL